MINCPKCGADNMVGAIFCRTCGGKLDLDQLRPEDLEEKEGTPLKKVLAIVWRLCIVTILLALIGLLVALFLPVQNVLDGNVDQKTMTKVNNRWKWVQKPNRRYYRFVFTSEEATALANKVMNLGNDGDASADNVGALAPRHLSIQFQDNGVVRLVLTSSLFGKMSVYSVLVGKLEAAKGGVEFETYSAKMGKISVPAQFHHIIIGRFDALLGTDPDVDYLQKNIRTLKISENSAKLALKCR